MIESFNALPALNLTTFLAAIVIFCPVDGFLPSLDGLLDLVKDPNPGRATLPSPLTPSEIAPTTASKASPACFLVNPSTFATIASTISDFPQKTHYWEQMNIRFLG